MRRPGLTAMLTDKNSVKRSIAITVLMSHCRELVRDYSDDEVSTILTLIFATKIGTNLVKKPMAAVKKFD